LDAHLTRVWEHLLKNAALPIGIGCEIDNPRVVRVKVVSAVRCRLTGEVRPDGGIRDCVPHLLGRRRRGKNSVRAKEKKGGNSRCSP
jgi:hypothetical protein